MPWQQLAADIVGERTEDRTQYRYQVVVISVPRQSGKTTFLRALGVHRCLVCGRDAFYTAQTGKDARARWRDLVKLVEAPGSPLARISRAYRSAGSERLEFTVTGASFHAFAPTPESLHGYTPPTVMIDEAFAQSEESGDLLMAAIGPAQITLPDRQLLIVSTRGTAESVFLNRWITRAVEESPRVAGLIWGADEDEDCYDPEVIRRRHPAVGYRLNGKLLTADDILAESHRNTRADYERGYMNRQSIAKNATVPPEIWRPLGIGDSAAPAPPTSQLVLSYAVGYEERAACIVASWRHNGHPRSKIVMSAAGAGWLPGAVVDLAERWAPRAIVALDKPPHRAATRKVQRADVDVVEVTGQQFVDATTDMVGRIDAGRFSHDGEPAMEYAFAGVVLKPTEDGRVMSSRLSSVDVTPAIATTLGTWHLDNLPPVEGKPEVVTGR